MKKFAIILFSVIILLSGCTLKQALNDTITNITRNITMSIIDEFNDTLNNISEQIGDEITQGFNNTLNNFILAILDKAKSIFPQSPVSEFTDEDIALLGISCSGNETEIAQCIKSWQVQNMDYDASKQDSSYSIRWNYAFPGIYPSNEIIREKTSNGRVYGICFDFAVIYCSIADYYGLDCRVMNSITKPSDRDSSLLAHATGLSPEEYNELYKKLIAKELDYSYNLVSKIVKETPEHYWAEVKINNSWVIFDATNDLISGSNTLETYKNTNDYEITQWINLETMEAITNYYSATDDLGNHGRATSIDDYMFSISSGETIPVAYYNSCSDVCEFFQGSMVNCQSNCESDIDFYNCYESCSSEKFYKICDFICSRELNPSDCYKTCSSEDLNLYCYMSC